MREDNDTSSNSSFSSIDLSERFYKPQRSDGEQYYAEVKFSRGVSTETQRRIREKIREVLATELEKEVSPCHHRLPSVHPRSRIIATKRFTLNEGVYPVFFFEDRTGSFPPEEKSEVVMYERWCDSCFPLNKNQKCVVAGIHVFLLHFSR